MKICLNKILKKKRNCSLIEFLPEIFFFSLVNFLFTQLWNCFFLYDDDYHVLLLETVEEEEEKEESNDTEDGGGQ